MTRRDVRLRYVALWLFVQTLVIFTVLAFVLELPLPLWPALGVIIGLGTAFTTYLAARQNEARGEGYRW